MKLQLPVIQGVIARRLLVNFRVRPDVIRPLLPAPFRPKLVHGWALAGLCLIRLEAVRPKGLPAALGLASENAAHRIAVDRDDAAGVREGVFILRRETDSRVNEVLGGRVFPGIHQRACFQAWETGQRIKLNVTEADGRPLVRIAGRAGEPWPAGSVFGSLAEASAFFQRGSCGWSPDGRGGCEGLEISIANWNAEPFLAEHVESAFFADRHRFPPGSVEFDSALLMRNLEHEWRSLGACTKRQSPPLRHHHGAAAFFEMP